MGKKVGISISDVILALPFYVYWVDKNNIILGCNLRQAKSLNTSVRQLIGKHIKDVLPKKEANRIIRANNKVMKERKEIVMEEFRLLENGKILNTLSHKIPLKNPQGVTIGLLEISVDITKQKEKEKNIINVNNQLKKEKNKAQNYLDNVLSREFGIMCSNLL